MTILNQKELLRKEMREKRRQHHNTVNHRDIEQRLLASFLSLDLLHEDSIIAGYYAQGTEFPVFSLMHALCLRGHQVALPVAGAACSPLVFREWNPLLSLESDAFGIPCPREAQKELLPDILLVPLLAFDKMRMRLGQGGGLYDITIADLRRKKTIITVGVAYTVQEIPSIPTLGTDVKLDYIATESGMI